MDGAVSVGLKVYTYLSIRSTHSHISKYSYPVSSTSAGFHVGVK